MKKVLLLCLLSLGLVGQVSAEVSIRSNKPVQSKNTTAPALNLSEDKRQEVEKITNSYNAQLAQFKPQIRDKNRALKLELVKDNPDVNALEALNKELFSIKEQEQLIRIKYQVELSKILTADQRRTLNKLAKSSVSNEGQGPAKPFKARQ